MLLFLLVVWLLMQVTQVHPCSLMFFPWTGCFIVTNIIVVSFLLLSLVVFQVHPVLYCCFNSVFQKDGMVHVDTQHCFFVVAAPVAVLLSSKYIHARVLPFWHRFPRVGWSMLTHIKF